MNIKPNYQIEMERQIAALDTRKRLLLHACCAPCSSYVLESLSEVFDIGVLFYNPNISPFEEYQKRFEEEKRLIAELPHKGKIELLEVDYDGEAFEKIAKGLEDAPEGGERCTRCFKLRLSRAAKTAKALGYDFFTTSLTISPLKDAQRLNQIGAFFAEKYAVPYLFSDFKKKNGYKRSCDLSREYNLYRQNYCGCRFSCSR